MRYSILPKPSARGSSILRTVLLTSLAFLTQTGYASGQDLRPVLDEAGSRWVTIDQVELGAVDLDLSRFVVLAPDVYQVRTRWRFANVQTSREGYRYETSVAVRAIDCRKREMALIAFADHDGRKMVHTEAQPVYAARWDRVNPESIVDQIATRVCELGHHDETRLSAAGG